MRLPLDAGHAYKATPRKNSFNLWEIRTSTCEGRHRGWPGWYAFELSISVPDNRYSGRTSPGIRVGVMTPAYPFFWGVR